MKKRLSSRKEPQQGRAQETVQAIVDAATYILSKDGWQRFTTNRIAARAGVNIASLYQYFPNKEAIAAEIQKRHGSITRSRLGALTGSLFGGDRERSLHSILKATVLMAIEEHKLAPRLHRALSEELPKSVRHTSSTSSVNEIADAWRKMAAPYFKHVPDPDIAMFISRTVIHAAVHEAAIAKPEWLSSELFADELIVLLEPYLDRSLHRA
jgi:AcrR family transcriptional regulator